jgi:hypothetical protein
MVTNSPLAKAKSCGRLRVKLKVLSDQGRTDNTACSLYGMARVPL